MYVGYITEECCGNTFFTPICILQSDEDLKTYLSMSQRKIDFEECEILDLDSIKKIRYIDVVYKNMNDSKWKECFTNDLETKNIRDLNRITILNESVHIKKVLEDDEKAEEVGNKLLKICPQLLFKKEANEIANQEETGMRMKGMYVEIDIDDLIESMT